MAFTLSYLAQILIAIFCDSLEKRNVFYNLNKVSGINLYLMYLNLLASEWINLRIFKFKSQNFKFYFEISSFIF